MVVYDYDSNAILTEPLTSRTITELLRAYFKLYDYLTARGLKPVLQRLENQAPGRLQSYMRAKSVTFQLVPPHNHRRNAAKKPIGTWKDHFIAGLSSLDPNFPMHLWCRLIPQATTTLNLLRQSHINPRLSAEAQLNGAFDFNRTRVVVHEKTTQRGWWDTPSIDGWHLGPAPKHYRCYRVYISKTASERHSDTVSFFFLQLPHAKNILCRRCHRRCHRTDQPCHFPTSVTTNLLPLTNSQQFFRRFPAHLLNYLQGWSPMNRHNPPQLIAIPYVHPQQPLFATNPHLRGCPSPLRNRQHQHIAIPCAPLSIMPTVALPIYSPTFTKPTHSSIQSLAKSRSIGISSKVLTPPPGHTPWPTNSDAYPKE
jgi:hypothetical protein